MVCCNVCAETRPIIAEGMQLLSLAEKQIQHLGQTGLGLVLALSQAWYQSALPGLSTGTADTYR